MKRMVLISVVVVLLFGMSCNVFCHEIVDFYGIDKDKAVAYNEALIKCHRWCQANGYTGFAETNVTYEQMALGWAVVIYGYGE